LHFGLLVLHTEPMKATRIPNQFGGTDYRIGDYVVIKEDTEAVDPADNDGVDELSRVIWGAVPAELYERRKGDVGLPDAVFEAGTLRRVRTWIEELER
jgi:hypothetical protein